MVFQLVGSIQCEATNVNGVLRRAFWRLGSLKPVRNNGRMPLDVLVIPVSPLSGECGIPVGSDPRILSFSLPNSQHAERFYHALMLKEMFVRWCRPTQWYSIFVDPI